MKKLFFYMTMVIGVPLNGMEDNQVTKAMMFGLERKIDAISGVVHAQARLVDTIGSNMILLMKACKDHADVVDRSSAATDSLTAAVDRQSDLFEDLKKEKDTSDAQLRSILRLSKSVHEEIVGCADAVDTCVDEVEAEQAELEGKYQSLESTVSILQRQVKKLQRQVKKLEPTNSQEQKEAEDPHDKRD